MESKTLRRVAVVQAAPVAFDLEATFERFEELLGEAASGGAELVVFPEAFLGGYPKGMNFGAPVGFRTPQGRQDFERYHAGAIELESQPGSSAEPRGLARLLEIVAGHGRDVVVGAIERFGGTLYCTAAFISGDGRLVDKHRKLVPTAQERVVWGRGDGSTMPVPAMGVGRVGAAICWENYMPLYRMTLYAKGVEFYCAPTVDDREVWLATMKHVAVEGRCFVLAACQFATAEDYPREIARDSATPDPMISGGSAIIDPMGEVLAGPVRGSQAVLFADCDLGAIARGRFDLDVTGHYARPDVFELSVDERRQGMRFES